MTIDARVRDAMHAYADPIEPEPGSWDAISARLDEPLAPVRASRRPMVLAAVAIALILVLIGAVAVRDADDSNDVVVEPGVSAPMPSRILGITVDDSVVVLQSKNSLRTGSFGQLGGIDPGVQTAITPDGKYAYFSRGTSSNDCGQRSVLRLPLAVGIRTGDIIPRATAPTVSPDGRYLAYLRCDPGTGEFREIVLRDLGTEAETVTPTDGAEYGDRLEFAADSQHVLVSVRRVLRGPIAQRGETEPVWWQPISELDVVGGERFPGRSIGLTLPSPEAGLDQLSWIGVRGNTGAYLGVTGSPATVVSLRGADPFTSTPLFKLPGAPTNVVSDASGDHILAVVDGSLYRWSVGDEVPTKVIGNYLGANWMPDPKAVPTALPNGIAAVRNHEIVVLGAQDGQQHSSLGAAEDVTVIAPTRDGRTLLLGASEPRSQCDFDAATTPPVLEELNTIDGRREPLVGGAYSPVVSPHDLAAFGYACDGNGLGMTNVATHANYRTDVLGSRASETDQRLRAVHPLDWSPNGKRLLSRVRLEGEDHDRYYVGRLWPAVPQRDTEVVEIPDGAIIRAGTFLDDDTLLLAVKTSSGTALWRHRIVSPPVEPPELVGEVVGQVPGLVTGLAADSSGGHVLMTTPDGKLLRWNAVDRTVTEVADGVSAAAWIPWS